MYGRIILDSNLVSALWPIYVCSTQTMICVISGTAKMSDAMYIGLTVTGPANEIARFRESVAGRDENGQEIILDFSSVTPIPRDTDPFTPKIQIDDH
jgi:hypothetical protein